MSTQLKTLSFAAIAIVGIGTLLFLNQPKEKTVRNQNDNFVLSADKLNHDFGTISMKNGKVKTVFKITNPASQAQTLTKLYTTCMCTEAKLSVNGKSYGPFGMPGHGAIPTFEQKLEQGKEAELEVEYDPAAHGPSGVGTVERSIILEGGNQTLLTLNIKATVTP